MPPPWMPLHPSTHLVVQILVFTCQPVPLQQRSIFRSLLSLNQLCLFQVALLVALMALAHNTSKTSLVPWLRIVEKCWSRHSLHLPILFRRRRSLHQSGQFFWSLITCLKEKSWWDQTYCCWPNLPSFSCQVFEQ